MESKRVGVVIPVFNTDSALVRECVESVLKQSYREIEICLVNDGSTDKECLELLKKFARADVRVSVIHKEYNGGISECRNVGVEWFAGSYACEVENPSTREALYGFRVKGENPYKITRLHKSKKAFAKGAFEFGGGGFIAPKIDYILFLDSDDVWKENLVWECLKRANGVDVVWFNHLPIYEIEASHIAYKALGESQLLDKEGVISGRDWIDFVAQSDDIEKSMTFVWRVLIDFRYLSHIGLKFANQCFMEDNLYGALLLYQADRIYTLPQKLIYYRVRKNSETNHTRERKNVGIPSFLEGLCEKFYGNRALTREVWVCMSCYVMKLHTQDFVKENASKYGIGILDAHLTKRFREIYLNFLYKESDLDTDYYLINCFNLILFLSENYKRFRPFDNLEKAFCVDDKKQKGVTQLLYDVVLYENNIVLGRNKIIKELEERIKALEEENSELYLKTLQNDFHQNLKVFR
ncbi:glycosyltransferase family 2 protein [Helicobacter sp.]|uniref:glycosyltransferase family 2 protein n=1 Tax=Helicobacter sp. TaxID=218 RepID=UPI0025B8F675|nr:glycosyltransferase [Helicobacter sp.]MCI5969435.1 glycosyltransferase [Helicobacter sp.]MDY2585690.1 glycosyltransferase [Helicobacter sp.]